MNNIKVLDCTLRDGGYINDWNFGFQNAKKIVNELNLANIDYIETGFLQDTSYDNDKTLFNEIIEINNIVPTSDIKSEIVGMIIFGKFDINKLVPKNKNIKLDAIRVTFKKDEIKPAFEYMKKIKECGYHLFVNPTNIESYSDAELLNIIEETNNLKPYCFSMVDTKGILKAKDTLRLFYLIDNNLNKDIALCFHSHNNLQLSFSNAQYLMNVCKDRELIIDSTVFGMGRGAGNLCSELLTQYINDNSSMGGGKRYEIIPILKIIDEQITPIFAKSPWGYSVPYYLATINHCHPNYAKYLVDKQTVTVEIINNLLKAIPDEKKSFYDSDLIKQLYLDNFSKTTDDSKSLDYLKNLLFDKNILVLASGKSIIKEKEKINQFIKEKKPFVISLNFIPKDYKEDLVFITNMKRFESLEDYSMPIVASSNIEKKPPQAIIINYSSYLNNSKLFDNVGLMLFKLLIKIGIKSINIAGFDGYSDTPAENYAADNLLNNIKAGEYDDRNKIMANELKRISSELKINFVTQSVYFDIMKTESL